MIAEARSQVPASAARSVFVNCPFDADYLPLLHALLFTIHDCGFIARLAVEDAGGAEMRIEKIVRLIRESQYSIHDISRVELSGPSKLPRFNMPFEAGVAFGAVRFDGAAGRDLLMLEAEAYRDQRTLSDLAGQDTQCHGNDARKLVAAVRTFLARKAVGEPTRGEAAIWARYDTFRAALPLMAEAVGISRAEIVTFEYLPDWSWFAGEWVLKG